MAEVTAAMIKGTIIGEMSTAINAARPGILDRESPSAASVPRKVARQVVAEATMMLMRNERLAQLRTRYFRSSDPGQFDYYSPRWYAEVLPVIQVRRFVGGWQLLGAAGYGAQRDSGSGWRSSRYLNGRITSPAFQKDWAVSGGILYTNTPVSTGFTYRYLQFNIGLTKAF